MNSFWERSYADVLAFGALTCVEPPFQNPRQVTQLLVSSPSLRVMVDSTSGPGSSDRLLGGLLEQNDDGVTSLSIAHALWSYFQDEILDLAALRAQFEDELADWADTDIVLTTYLADKYAKARLLKAGTTHENLAKVGKWVDPRDPLLVPTHLLELGLVQDHWGGADLRASSPESLCKLIDLAQSADALRLRSSKTKNKYTKALTYSKRLCAVLAEN